MADVYASRDGLFQPTATQEPAPSTRLEMVRHRFLEKLPDRRREILDCARHIDQFGLGTDATAGISHHAHKIAGVAATLGFPTLSDAAMVVDASASRAAAREVLLEDVDVLLEEIDRIDPPGR